MQHEQPIHERSKSRNETNPMAQTFQRNGTQSGSYQKQKIIPIGSSPSPSVGEYIESKRQRSVSLNDSNYFMMQQSVTSTCDSFGDLSILQTRRLTGDTSRKGEEWWKICQTNERKRPVAGNDITMESTTSQAVLNDKCSTRGVRPMRVPQSYNHNKMYIVSSKKAQYGHLVSNHGEMARDENRSPIVYRRHEEEVTKDLTPLWFHPFSTGG